LTGNDGDIARIVDLGWPDSPTLSGESKASSKNSCCKDAIRLFTEMISSTRKALLPAKAKPFLSFPFLAAARARAIFSLLAGFNAFIGTIEELFLTFSWHHL